MWFTRNLMLTHLMSGCRYVILRCFLLAYSYNIVKMDLVNSPKYAECSSDFLSSDNTTKKRQLNSTNEIFVKAAVTIAVFFALVSLAIAVVSHISIQVLESKVEKCAMLTDLSRTAREETEGLEDNQELKALAEEVAEIRAKVKELITNASIEHSDFKLIIDNIREEITTLYKAKGNT